MSHSTQFVQQRKKKNNERRIDFSLAVFVSNGETVNETMSRDRDSAKEKERKIFPRVLNESQSLRLCDTKMYENYYIKLSCGCVYADFVGAKKIRTKKKINREEDSNDKRRKRIILDWLSIQTQL